MKASLKWMKELLPGLTAPADEVEQRLTSAGLEVEGTESPAEALAAIVTAEVRTCEKHPDADKLSICTVFDGEADNNVVCGAPNVRTGLKVAFAPVGTTLPGGLTLERRKIRGVLSEGMICAEDELGLSDDHDGVMELPAGTAAGLKLVDLLKLDDTIYELGVTPNRPDVLSHFGLARELSAIYGQPMPTAQVSLQEVDTEAVGQATVKIEATERCSKYVGRVIKGVKVQPSPADVQQRLQSVGQRPISNVVDATNIALMELGHPLHAFDLHRLKEHTVIVRQAKAGESIELLDGSKKKLSEDDVVIADAERPVALAGVMGGANSEVHEQTVDILLEAAVFDASSVRRSARRHALHTEASHRFERGVDFEMVEAAIDRCAELIVQMGGGEVQKGRVSVAGSAPTRHAVPIRAERAQRVLGRPVEQAEVDTTLTRLGFIGMTEAERADWTTIDLNWDLRYASATWFRAPSWRVDISREEDLIEEVGRLHGYDDLPSQMPPSGKAVWRSAPKADTEDQVRDQLVAQGFYEAISLAFSSKKDAQAMGVNEGAVVVANPLGEESQLMRVSMLPPLLQAAQLNQDNLPSVTDLRLFELGRSFTWTGADKIPVQGRKLGIVMRGRRYPTGWSNDASVMDAYDLKGVLDGLCARFDVQPEVQAHEEVWLHPRSGSALIQDGQILARFGEAHPHLMQRYGLEGPPAFVAEVDVDALAAHGHSHATFAPVAKLPPAQRDLSFFVKKAVSAAAVLGAVRTAGQGGLLEDVQIFDVYEGKGVPEDEKSLAISMTFRASKRTLTDAEVEAAQQPILKALEGLGARIRSA